MVEKTIVRLVIWDAIAPIMTSLLCTHANASAFSETRDWPVCLIYHVFGYLLNNNLFMEIHESFMDNYDRIIDLHNWTYLSNCIFNFL